MSDPHLLAVFTKAGHMFEQLNWPELWIVKRNKTNLRHGGLGQSWRTNQHPHTETELNPNIEFLTSTTLHTSAQHQQWAPKTLAFEKFGPFRPSIDFHFGKLSLCSNYYCLRSMWYLVLDLAIQSGSTNSILGSPSPWICLTLPLLSPF